MMTRRDLFKYLAAVGVAVSIPAEGTPEAQEEVASDTNTYRHVREKRTLGLLRLCVQGREEGSIKAESVVIWLTGPSADGERIPFARFIVNTMVPFEYIPQMSDIPVFTGGALPHIECNTEVLNYTATLLDFETGYTEVVGFRDGEAFDAIVSMGNVHEEEVEEEEVEEEGDEPRTA